MAGLLSNVEHVNCSDSGGQKRLMCISPGGVHDETAWIFANCLGKCSWTLIDENISPSLVAWFGGIKLGAVRKADLWHDNLALEFGFAHLAFDLTSVDSNISEVCQQFLGTILTANKCKQLWSVVDESSPAVSINKSWMC